MILASLLLVFQQEWVDTHRIFLRNGNFIDCRLVGQDHEYVRARLPFGEILVKQDQVGKVEGIHRREILPAPKHSEVILQSLRPSVEEISKTVKVSPTPPSDLREKLERYVAACDPANSAAMGSEMARLGKAAAPYLAAMAQDTSAKFPAAHAAIRALGELGEIDALARVLTSSLVDRRSTAVETLSAIRNDASLSALMEALRDSNSAVSARAAEEIIARAKSGELRDVVRRLTTRLREDRSYAAGVVRCFSKLGGDEVEDALEEMIRDRDEYVRVAAIQGLGELGTEEAKPLVRESLRDDSLVVRKEACIAAGHLKDRDAVADLIDRAGEENEGLAQNAGWALREITGELFKEHELWVRWWEQGGKQKFSNP